MIWFVADDQTIKKSRSDLNCFAFENNLFEGCLAALVWSTIPALTKPKQHTALAMEVWPTEFGNS